ncbi:MAG TPA: site-specific DNA-methyltransferase [bacterium]|nr:site-specific DNA-methyltransferase [bacterium]
MGKLNGANGKQSRPTREKVARESSAIVPEQVEKLKELFPEAVSEGNVDFDKLRQTLGDEVDAGPERYSFTWAGKRDSIKLLQVPSRATLVPSPDESIDWDTTNNVFIEGENLEVLKLLYKAYYGRVKMIYIDPPYNTGKDFIYPDNFADPLDTYLRLTGQKDSEGNVLTSNPETSGRYHSSWLSMMYPRLFVARQLLRDDGVIFVSIDDNEVYNLRAAMNEVFGEENFIATVIWQKVYAPKNTARHFSEDHDYVVVYARDGAYWRPGLLPRTAAADARYINPDNDPRGLWKPSDLTARNYYSKGKYEVKGPTGKKFTSGMGTYWRQTYEKFLELDRDKRIWWGSGGTNMPALKRFLTEVQAGIVPQTLWTYDEVGHTQEAKKELLEFVKFEDTDNVLDTVKPTRLLQRMLKLTTSPTEFDIVVDFFSGSGPLAHAVMKQNAEDGGNRRYVCAQLPEPLPTPEKRLKTIADIGKERIRRVIAKMKNEQAVKLASDGPQDLGFRVYKLAESNMKPWKGTDEKDPEKYAKTMEMFLDPLVERWRPENVIAEVALKEAGFGLNCRVEAAKPQMNTDEHRSVEARKDNRNAGKKDKEPDVFKVTDEDKEQFFYICLDDKVRLEDVKFLNLTRDMLFVCRDVALDDETAANLALQCRLRTI